MVIFYGREDDMETVCEVQGGLCSVCAEVRRFFMTLTYTQVNIFWVPLFKLRKKYFYRCGICRNGTEISEATKWPHNEIR